MAKQKNDKFIINRDILPKGKQGGVDWFNTKEIEVYFTDDEKSYTLKVEDIIKDKNKITKILLSYNNNPYKRYLQGGQILNGNLEDLFSYFYIKGNKLRPFKQSEDGTYWIGITDKDEEFYFNGKNSKEIMKYNWYISNGYLVTKKMEGLNQVNIRLNRMGLGVTDRNIVVNHCGGNILDNRVEKLSISDHKDNAKEHLPSKLNNTGITGLTKTKTDTYRIQCTINGFSYTYEYKTKDEALIDLLIIQRYYDYRHNENLYYMLKDISEEYVNKLIKQVKENISNRKVNPIINKNRFELSEDKTFYYMYDTNDNKCKISIEDLELVKQGNWRYTLNNGKEYFSGDIIYQGKRKGIFLHRFLMDLMNIKYRHWYIDHLDGDGLNNTRDNIVITDAKGNGINKQGRGYTKYAENIYQSQFVALDKKYVKRFKTEIEAIEWVASIKKEAMRQRLQFHSRNELDTYLKQQELVQAI